MRDIRHFIDGRQVEGRSGRFGDVFNPSTGEVQARVQLATAEEVDVAVQTALHAFEGWSAVKPQRRARVMFEFTRLVENEMNSLAEMLSSEHGKVIADAKGDIQRGLEVIEFDCGIPHAVVGVTALGSLVLFLKFGITWEYLLYFSFLSALIVITVIDLYHQIIPDVISLPGIGVGFIASLILPQLTWLNSLIGILLGGGSLFLVATVYQWLFKREGMGGGDIKLLAMIGAFLGWKSVILTILLGSLVGSLIGMMVMVMKGKVFKYAIPFGPFLSLGAVISLFYGEEIVTGSLWLIK